jgi:hypothetical protein
MLDPKDCLLAQRWINGVVAAGYMAAFLFAATAGGSGLAARANPAPGGSVFAAGHLHQPGETAGPKVYASAH